MNVLIIEDEIRAAELLSKMLLKNLDSVQILGVIESVKSAVEWFANNTHPDLIFMDIQLADGISFEIFESVEVRSPIVFTTAYDQYSIKAFKVNSIDYLLKPIVESDLLRAVEKYQRVRSDKKNGGIDTLMLKKLMNNLAEDKYRKRFIVKEGSSMTFVQVCDISYFYSEDGVTFLMTRAEKRYMVDMTLDSIEKDIDSQTFFRINRGQIVSIESVQKIKPYFNNRLILEMSSANGNDFIVSRSKSTVFKSWINQ